MDINSLLEKWEECKSQKTLLEKKCEKYRKSISQHMDKKELNQLVSKNYIVTRRTNTRQQLSKQNVPSDIWDRYATRFSYESIHLKKK